MSVCKALFSSCTGDIMHGVLGILCVCAYIYLFLGQCFVFITLLTH